MKKYAVSNLCWLSLFTRTKWLAAFFLSLLLCGDMFAQVSDLTRAQVSALMGDKEARTPVQRKISSQLLMEIKLRRDGFINKAVPKLRSSVPLERDGRVKVDIDATVSAQLLKAIAAAGGTVLGSFPADQKVRAILPLETVEAVAARGDVKFIRPAARAMLNTGSVNSEGDVAHRANSARTAGATGAGVTVGVLSDSIDDPQGSLGAAIASGDIDSNNTFTLNGQAGTGEGEGLAMMEIVHDLAPASTLIFATGSSGDAQMAQNIRDLAAVGCKVIIDDISYFNEPPFQDGTISKAVNDVSAQGVLYFSSARNSGNKDANTSGTWEGNFVDGGDAAGLDGHVGSRYHAFSGVVKNLVKSTNAPRADLFWSDPLGGSTNDYDLYVLDSVGNVVDLSDDTQNGTQDPYEAVSTLVTGQSISIVKYSGLGRFLHLDTGRGTINISTAGNVRGHNASGAPNAFSVAAVSAAGRSTPFVGGTSVTTESFSSDGPRRIFYNPDGSAITPGNFLSTGGLLLQKPDLTAADGVVTTLPSSSGLNPFYGTSAAAPHAGAIAALVLSYQPFATPAQVRAALLGSCLDIQATGFDRDSGPGIAMALTAVKSQTRNTDFNSDGRTDFVLYNPTTRRSALWYLTNNVFTGSAYGPTPPVGWKLIGVADFNRDGQPDYLLLNAETRQTAIWYLSGSTFIGGDFGPTVAVGYVLTAAADFNRDGHPDYLLYNSATRQTVIWYLSGPAYIGYAYGPVIAAGYNIAGLADFNRDGQVDFALFNPTNRVTAIWYLSGTTLSGGVYGPTIATGYQLVGAADFNNDSKPDYVLYNPTSRQTALWYLNNNLFVSGASGPSLGSGYILAAP